VPHRGTGRRRHADHAGEAGRSPDQAECAAKSSSSEEEASVGRRQPLQTRHDPTVARESELTAQPSEGGGLGPSHDVAPGQRVRERNDGAFDAEDHPAGRVVARRFHRLPDHGRTTRLDVVPDDSAARIDVTDHQRSPVSPDFVEPPRRRGTSSDERGSEHQREYCGNPTHRRTLLRRIERLCDPIASLGRARFTPSQ
jgi:hypothetical protein